MCILGHTYPLASYPCLAVALKIRSNHGLVAAFVCNTSSQAHREAADSHVDMCKGMLKCRAAFATLQDSSAMLQAVLAMLQALLQPFRTFLQPFRTILQPSGYFYVPNKHRHHLDKHMLQAHATS